MGEVRARGRDDGFFRVGWLTKIVVVFAVIGVFGLDGVTLALGHLRLDDAATQAAMAASDGYGPHRDTAAAMAAARTAAATDQATVTKLVFADGFVTATVHGTIQTMVIKHLPGTATMLSPTATVTVKIVS